MLKYLKDAGLHYQHHDVAVDLGPGHRYNKTGHSFRLWTNCGKTIRSRSYGTVVLTPSYRVTERQTIQGVAKAAVKDLAHLTDIGVCTKGEMLLLNADGTHKDKSTTSATGPCFLETQHDPDIAALVSKYKIDFATMVTEDSSIFSSIPGETDIRGKGSQFEASFNFIYHFAIKKDNGYVMCVDSDLQGTDGFVYRMCLGLHQGYSYLTPLYCRHKYEGRATNHLMFPLYAAVTGNVVRQPIGGDFAFNAKMLAYFTEGQRWSKSWRDFGIDIGMTITAGTSGLSIGQVCLPRKINYVGKDARDQIGDMFVQAGRSLFNGLLNYLESHYWQPKDVKSAPVLQLQSEDFRNNIAKTELNDSSEIINALCNFLSLHNSKSFQRDGKEVLGYLYKDIQNIFDQLENLDHDITELTRSKSHDESQSAVIKKVSCLNHSVLLTADKWAQVVFQCFKQFQIRSKENEEKACKTVLRNVLLCVFYLRVFSFNVQTFKLQSYPDAEDILTQQMHAFVKVAPKMLL